MTNLPIIPFTKEFLAMLAMSEKEAYALKPVFATRCERLSSTNTFLERALIVSQSGTMYLFDTEHKRLTHLLELGDKRDTSHAVTVVSDREPNVQQLMCVSIKVEGGRMAQGTPSPGTSPTRNRSDTVRGSPSRETGGGSDTELVLQFHCGRANVALGFVAMIRNFVAINGIKNGFQLTVLEPDEPPLVEKLRNRRGSVALLANRIAAAKESLLAPPPEQQQTVKDIAKQQRRSLERAGEEIQVLPPATIPTAQEMALKQKQKLKEQQERERQEKLAAQQRSLTAPQGEAKANDDGSYSHHDDGSGGVASRDLLDDDELGSEMGGPTRGRPAAGGLLSAIQRRGTIHKQRNQQSSSMEDLDEASLGDLPIDDGNAYPMVLQGVARATTSSPRPTSRQDDENENDDDDPKPLRQTVSPSQQRRSPFRQSSTGLPEESRSNASLVSDEHPYSRPLTPGAGAGADREISSAGTKPPLSSILQRMRQQTMRVEADRQSDRQSELSRLIDAEDLRVPSALQPSFTDHAEEDALIDSLTTEEAQAVVSSILASMEDAKEEYLALYQQRAELRKELKKQYSVTLTKDHAMQLSLLIWNICNGRLTQHFDAAALEAAKVHPVLSFQTR